MNKSDIKDFINNLDEKHSDDIIRVLLPYVEEVKPTLEEIAIFEMADKMQGDEPLTRHEDINWD